MRPWLPDGRCAKQYVLCHDTVALHTRCCSWHTLTSPNVSKATNLVNHLLASQSDPSRWSGLSHGGSSFLPWTLQKGQRLSVFLQTQGVAICQMRSRHPHPDWLSIVLHCVSTKCRLGFDCLLLYPAMVNLFTIHQRSKAAFSGR